LWAVLAAGVSVGIDVETPVNFPDFYPVSKVFTPGETTIMDGLFCNRNSGSAALWSCKEAVVKARRTGFLDIAPRDVEIIAMSRHCDYHHVEIRAGQVTYFAILKKKGSLWCAIAYPVLPTIKPA
jgi:phosphopantetheinyl transferase